MPGPPIADASSLDRQSMLLAALEYLAGQQQQAAGRWLDSGNVEKAEAYAALTRRNLDLAAKVRARLVAASRDTAN